MCLIANFAIVIITSFYIISTMCYKRIEYGKACGEGANLGVCKTIPECPSALAELKKPTPSILLGCGFLANQTQIICCKDFKAAPSTDHSHGIIKNDGSVWGRVPISFTNKPNRILPDRNRGKKSEEACKEYAAKIAPSIISFITGGVDATLGEFPHMAQIGYESGILTGVTDWKCGGSLIHVRFILTAAHCVETTGNNPPRVVRLGFVDSSLSSNTNLVESDVLHYTPHPNYDRTYKLNDIALIELVNEIKIQTNVHPACLYQKDDDPIIVTATGWGSTSTEDEAQILQKVDIESTNLNNCSKLYAQNFRQNITSKQMCRLTTNKIADTCKGDSGGPIQILRFDEKYIYDIVGVTSYGGTGCGDGETPGIYARVYSYIDWIESIVWP